MKIPLRISALLEILFFSLVSICFVPNKSSIKLPFMSNCFVPDYLSHPLACIPTETRLPWIRNIIRLLKTWLPSEGGSPKRYLEICTPRTCRDSRRGLTQVRFQSSRIKQNKENLIGNLKKNSTLNTFSGFPPCEYRY